LSKAWPFHWHLNFSLPMKLVWEWLSLLAFVECVYVVPIASCTNTHFHIPQLWNSELAHCICASYLNTLPSIRPQCSPHFKYIQWGQSQCPQGLRLKSPTIDLFVCRCVPSLNASKLAHAYVWAHPLRSGSHCTPSVASVKTTPMSPTLRHIFLVKKSWHNFWETTLHTKRQPLPT
jgi:hypothetical protein